MLLRTLGLTGSLLLPALAQEATNTVEVPEGTGAQQAVELASRVRPTPQQLAWQDLQFTCFVHFGPNTFNGVEWGTGDENPADFAPTELDPAQWVRAAKAAGMRMVMLTVKHHDGFCLWPSAYTAHDSAAGPLGERDLVAELAAACREEGLELGLYLSPADLYQMKDGTPESFYGNGSQPQPTVIPTAPEHFRDAPATAREGDGPRFEYAVDDYNRYFLNQLYEILTQYGPIREIWFDGAHPKQKGNQQYDYAAWYGMIRALQPEIVIAINGPDVRWCGNEAGDTRESEWSVIPFPQPPGEIVYGDQRDADLGSRARITDESVRSLHWYPAETNTKIRPGWFWAPGKDGEVRSVDNLFDLYERATGGNSLLLLNLSPDPRGLIPELDVQRLEWLGQRIEETYGQALTTRYTRFPTPTEAGEVRAEEEPITWLNDGELQRQASILPISAEESALAAVAAEPLTLNRAVLAEPVADSGQLIEEYALDAWVADTDPATAGAQGGWREISRGTTVGYREIARFETVTTFGVRLRILAARAQPRISEFTLHFAAPALAEPRATRDRVGLVTLDGGGVGGAIHYTTDGSEPTAASPAYSGPFSAPGVTVVRALEVGPDGSLGPIGERRFDVAPARWTLTLDPASAAVAEGVAAAAIDADPATVLRTAAGAAELDLGETLDLRGLVYTPPTDGDPGVLKRFRVLARAEATDEWQPVGEFGFANIQNDPAPRTVEWDSTPARQLRLEFLETVEPGAPVALAELSVLSHEP